VSTAPLRWARFVAVGDSFTEGLNDTEPVGHPGVRTPDRFTGWADRLAALLAADAESAGGRLRYANLAVRGRLLADIAGRQVDAALELGPDLAASSAAATTSCGPGPTSTPSATGSSGRWRGSGPPAPTCCCARRSTPARRR